MKHPQIKPITRKGWAFLVIGSLLALVLFAGWLFYDLPPLERATEYRPVPSVLLLDEQQRVIYEFLPQNTGRHRPVAIEQIPQALIDATVATEDSRFYQNPGFDILSIGQSLFTNTQEGQIVRGGSTITQQVVRNLILPIEEQRQRTIRRKAREMFLAWRLTQSLPKEEILALYLNNMYYGNLAYGVEAASWTYFAKPVSELDLAESALLAGLSQAPEYYNPLVFPERARARQKVVLQLMQRQGKIDAVQREYAEKQSLAFSRDPYPTQALHFSFWVQDQLETILTAQQLENPYGLIIYTTLNLDWQRQAENAIQRQIKALKENREGIDHQANSMALVALNPQTGAVQAMVGSPDYFDQKNGGAVNMAVMPRQPGSAIKPLVYAAALDPSQVTPWTAATMLLDVRTNFVSKDGEAYIPSNFDGLEHGPVLLRDALASSLNIPAVLTLEHVGLEAFGKFASELGIARLGNSANYDLSLALGGGDVSLLELSVAYGAFGNGGYRVYPYGIEKVTDGRGQILYEHLEETQVRVMDERVAWLISDILSDDDARKMGFGENSLLRIDRPAAVKTGTTNNFHDNWTIGYIPDLVVGVWAGNTDQQPMRNVTGLTGAGPVWHNFIRSVYESKPAAAFNRPDGLVQVEVCSLSGMLPTDACTYRRREWFIEGTEPLVEDNIMQAVELDITTNLPTNPQTPAQNRVTRVVLNLPPQAHAWAKAQGYALIDEQSLTSAHTDLSSAELLVTNPAARSVYFIADNLPAEVQQLAIQVASQGTFETVTIRVDEEEIGNLPFPPYQAWWQLSPGMHVVQAEGRTMDGQIITSQPVVFEVHSDS